MSQNAPNEQSMEDILASIRRIISDDTPSGEASGTARDAHAERSNLPGSEPRGPEFAMPNGGPDGRHGPMAAQNVPASSRPEPIAPPTTGEDPLADLIGEPRNGPPPGAPALGQAAQTQPQTQPQVPSAPHAPAAAHPGSVSVAQDQRSANISAPTSATGTPAAPVGPAQTERAMRPVGELWALNRRLPAPPGVEAAPGAPSRPSSSESASDRPGDDGISPRLEVQRADSTNMAEANTPEHAGDGAVRDASRPAADGHHAGLAVGDGHVGSDEETTLTDSVADLATAQRSGHDGEVRSAFDQDTDPTFPAADPEIPSQRVVHHEVSSHEIAGHEVSDETTAEPDLTDADAPPPRDEPSKPRVHSIAGMSMAERSALRSVEPDSRSAAHADTPFGALDTGEPFGEEGERDGLTAADASPHDVANINAADVGFSDPGPGDVSRMRRDAVDAGRARNGVTDGRTTDHGSDGGTEAGSQTALQRLRASFSDATANSDRVRRAPDAPANGGLVRERSVRAGDERDHDVRAHDETTSAVEDQPEFEPTENAASDREGWADTPTDAPATFAATPPADVAFAGSSQPASDNQAASGRHKPEAAFEAGANEALETMVSSLLKPMLKDWLDENLPRIAEKVVAEEIKNRSRSD